MKKIIFLSLMSGSVFLCDAQTDADKAAVNQVATSFNNSWNKHDFKDMSNYTMKDADFINPGGIWWKGRDVQKSLQHVHDTLLKNTPMTTLSTSVRFVTPSFVLVTIIAKFGAYYPPAGVDNGQNKAGDNRVISTMVIVKQKDKWLLASLQATDINEYLVKIDPLSGTPRQ